MFRFTSTGIQSDVMFCVFDTCIYIGIVNRKYLGLIIHKFII